MYFLTPPPRQHQQKAMMADFSEDSAVVVKKNLAKTKPDETLIKFFVSQ